jgi:hypothetical protein
MTLSKSFLAGAGLSFFGLLLLAELSLRLSVPTGFWYRHFDFSGDMTSLAEMRDRIRYSAPAEHRILLLGDSVLGASALMEHRIPDARQETLSFFLRNELEGKDLYALSLGSDGMLLPDIEGLSVEFSSHPPEKILLLLNFRMFAKDFTEGSKALSRNFLLPDLPEDIQKRLALEIPPTAEAQLSDRLYGDMCGSWFLFRETQMAKTLWYYPSQKDFFQRQLERLLGTNETESDIVEAALKQKVVPYYQPYLWDPNALPLTCLRRVLDQWTAQHIPVVVVLTPQNKKFLGNYLDEPSFEKNRKSLAAFLKPYSSFSMVYEDWADRYPSTLFLDHCHLTPEGNAQYAKDLAKLLLESN